MSDRYASMERMRRAAIIACLTGLWCVTGGCGIHQPTNPSFPVSMREAKAALKAMRAQPKPMARPIVILGGFMDPGLGPIPVTHQIKKIAADPHLVSVGFMGQFSFASCRNKVIRKVQEAFPSDDPDWTVEVDVVGVSMGGLVARYAAAPPRDEGEEHRRLRIHTLYTISAPHRGANLAVLPTFDPVQIAMRKGSPLLAYLGEQLAQADYEVVPYVRLEDTIVGPGNASPVGVNPWWVSNRLFHSAHVGAVMDARIIADIARRLRGEPTLTQGVPAPLPGRASARQDAAAVGAQQAP